MFYRKLQQQTYKLKQTGTHKWINRTSDIWRLWYSVFHQWLSSVLFEMHFKSIIHKTQCNIGTQNAFEVILVLAGIRVMVIKVLITDNRTVLFFFFLQWNGRQQAKERKMAAHLHPWKTGIFENWYHVCTYTAAEHVDNNNSTLGSRYQALAISINKKPL